MSPEQIAEIAHEINRSYCESIGDASQTPWRFAPKWQQESIIDGVKFHLRNPEASPEDGHLRWLEEKLSRGWQYGLLKSEGDKTHPNCIAYDRLPPEQRSKDYIFRAVVQQLSKLAD